MGDPSLQSLTDIYYIKADLRVPIFIEHFHGDEDTFHALLTELDTPDSLRNTLILKEPVATVSNWHLLFDWLADTYRLHKIVDLLYETFFHINRRQIYIDFIWDRNLAILWPSGKYFQYISTPHPGPFKMD